MIALLAALSIFFLQINVYAANADSMDIKLNLEKQDKMTPFQQLTGDTLKSNLNKDDIGIKPGFIGRSYSTQQDSAYFKALKTNLPFNVRFNNDLLAFSGQWRYHKELMEGNPWNIAMKNTQVPPSFYLPTGQQIVAYQYNLMQSQYVQGVNTLNLNGGIISVNALGKFFGLVEDVSPVLKFNLDYAEDVEIVIYSVQASVVSTLYHGRLFPGSYKFTWNGRDDKGKPMPSGDYVAEIQIGKVKYIRKRINIP